MKSFRGILLWTVIAFCALGTGAFLQTTAIVAEKPVIRDNRLARVLGPARVVQVSDLHIRKYGYREKELVSLIRHIDPDIVFITGDLVGEKQGVPACLSVMEQIAPGRAVIAVFGNNDHPDPKPGRSIVRFLRGMYSIIVPYDLRISIDRRLPFLRVPRMMVGEGDPRSIDSREFTGELIRRKVIVLNNQSVKVTIDGRDVFVAGVDDNFLMYDDIFAAAAGIPAGAPAILLAHSPNIVEKADISAFSLVLSGHTHGGQIVIPGRGPLFLNNPAHSSKRMVSGYYPADKVYINRGIGTVMLPLRLFCRPEITVFTFETSDAGH